MSTGADLLLHRLREHGVEICFANPGTTELDLVRALERTPGLRCVLGLQENICTGAADGWGRMTGRPAATLLHLGPGLANGAANLHNARRARTPVINIVGDHASWHLPFDAPLSSDIESLARPVSGWVRRIGSAAEASAVATEAWARSRAGGGQGVTLVFPADFQAEEVAAEAVASTVSPPRLSSSPSPARGEGSGPQDASCAGGQEWGTAVAAERLRAARQPVFLLGGGGERSALGERGQRAAARLVAHLGGRAFAETFPARAERGGGLPDFDRLPYFPEPARAVLDPADVVVLAGALPPVTYFGYPGQPSRMVDDGRLLTLCGPGDDAAAALEALADALGAPPLPAPASQGAAAGSAPAPASPGGGAASATTPTPEAPSDPPVDTALTPALVGALLARALPAQAVVSVEGGTCGYPFHAASAAAARHTALTNTGGAIGQGLPVALGAALACPGRRVVALLSDGSTQYTVQALWSLAHERLPVTVLIAANHQYAILRNELKRGGALLSAAAAAMTSLADPRIDWVALAGAYGVPGCRATTTGEFDDALRQAFATPGPMLVEMAL
jgi:acetolactate synthase-1/2/3 large subunit